MSTPIRDVLRADSPLVPRVADGLQALKRADVSRVAEDIRTRFADSLDLDAAFARQHPNENRWDYLLGDGQTARVVALEPHSAKSDEVTTVINKKKRALEQLRKHTRPGKRVARWFWVSSGTVHFPDTDGVKLRLDQENIVFAGKLLMKKHLDYT